MTRPVNVPDSALLAGILTITKQNAAAAAEL